MRCAMSSSRCAEFHSGNTCCTASAARAPMMWTTLKFHRCFYRPEFYKAIEVHRFSGHGPTPCMGSFRLCMFAISLQLFFGKANAGYFRPGVHNPRDEIIINVWFFVRLTVPQTSTPSSSALCASIAPRTTSPIAYTLSTFVFKMVANRNFPLSSSIPIFSRPNPSV